MLISCMRELCIYSLIYNEFRFIQFRFILEFRSLENDFFVIYVYFEDRSMSGKISLVS